MGMLPALDRSKFGRGGCVLNDKAGRYVFDGEPGPVDVVGS
jgi:hypothetical protein